MSTEGTTTATTTIESSTIATQYCTGTVPCGWAIYGNNKKKIIQYFLKNTCKCSPDDVCILDGEDLSLGAHVYRCKDKRNPKAA
jgi:hypothetical protein